MAGTGKVATYGDLEAASNRMAHFFRAMGLVPGDRLALLLNNSVELFKIAWGAQRAGLIFTLLSTKLAPAEAAFIVEDCGAKMVIADAAVADLAIKLAALRPGVRFMSVRGVLADHEALEPRLSGLPSTPIDDECNGIDMLYSSGTTGRPKGILSNPPPGPLAQENALVRRGRILYAMDADTVFLSPAPLYHAAPLRWSLAVQRFGGTVVVMERFDPAAALRAIEQYRVTHAQWVPTHFIRMLRLPSEVRDAADLSSLRAVFHAAAPCPVPIKRAMIDWWGPIVHEFYSSTEGIGSTAISSSEWLAHPGSVGRPFESEARIVGEDGTILPPDEEGLIQMRCAARFSYHGDPVATARAYTEDGFATVGDVGRMDKDGYLYLTDRRAHLIISGGVNIYPQEVEDALNAHPKVADAAVIGAPDDEMGEAVIAVVQPGTGIAGGDDLALELTSFLRERISHVKVPRRIDFVVELPREDSGKLFKRKIRDGYWAGQDGRV